MFGRITDVEIKKQKIDVKQPERKKCPACERFIKTIDLSEKKCKNPKLHEGKLKIAKLLEGLKSSRGAAQTKLIKEIKELEKTYKIPKTECYTFDNPFTIKKMELNS